MHKNVIKYNIENLNTSKVNLINPNFWMFLKNEFRIQVLIYNIRLNNQKNENWCKKKFVG